MQTVNVEQAAPPGLPVDQSAIALNPVIVHKADIPLCLSRQLWHGVLAELTAGIGIISCLGIIACIVVEEDR